MLIEIELVEVKNRHWAIVIIFEGRKPEILRVDNSHYTSYMYFMKLSNTLRKSNYFKPRYLGHQESPAKLIFESPMWYPETERK